MWGGGWGEEKATRGQTSLREGTNCPPCKIHLRYYLGEAVLLRAAAINRPCETKKQQLERRRNLFLSSSKSLITVIRNLFSACARPVASSAEREGSILFRGSSTERLPALDLYPFSGRENLWCTAIKHCSNAFVERIFSSHRSKIHETLDLKASGTPHWAPAALAHSSRSLGGPLSSEKLQNQQQRCS